MNAIETVKARPDESLSEQKIHHLEFNVWIFSAVFAAVLLALGFFGWKTIWWESLIGFAMGILGFRMLVVSVSGMNSRGNRSIGKAAFFSLFKTAGLFIAFFILHQMHVQIIQIIGGLLFSQLAVFSAVMLTWEPPASKKVQS